MLLFRVSQFFPEAVDKWTEKGTGSALLETLMTLATGGKVTGVGSARITGCAKTLRVTGMVTGAEPDAWGIAVTEPV